MVNRFDEQPTLYTRALKSGKSLSQKRTNRQTPTYGDLVIALQFGGVMFLDAWILSCVTAESMVAPAGIIVTSANRPLGPGYLDDLDRPEMRYSTTTGSAFYRRLLGI